MFAVIRTGGKQYTVAEDQTLRLGKLAAKPGEIVTFPVMLLGGDKPAFGMPTVAGALVAAEVVEHARGDKVIVFKKRRRKNSRRRRGYRDDFTLVRITEILTDGKQPSKTAKPRPQKAKAAPQGEKAADKKPATKEKPAGEKPKEKSKKK
jgi:large subunit ribosomal protein L21